MDTHTCPKCNNLISPQAKFCTHCGEPTALPTPVTAPPRRRLGLWIAVGVGVILCCLAVVAVALFIWLRTDLLPDFPALGRSNPTPTSREQDSPQTTTTSEESALPEPTGRPAVQPPEGPMSEFAGTQIQVITDPYWAPFESYDANGKMIGFDIDLMDAIAQQAGFQVEFIEVAWDGLLTSITDCEYDVAIAAITITPERQANMLFSDPYINDGQVIVAQVDNPAITGLDSLNGRPVAVQVGTLAEEFLRDFPEVITVPYDDISYAFEALADGSVDALITYHTLALQYNSDYSGELVIVGEPLTHEGIGIALCRDNTALQAVINQALAELSAEGFIEALTHTWFER